jgi:murein lipoprotein
MDYNTSTKYPKGVSNMTNTLFKALPIAVLLAVGGCASTSDIDSVKTSAAQAQKTADDAKASAASAEKTAAAAQATANQALQTANEAKAAADEANTKIDRAFKKSMHK